MVVVSDAKHNNVLSDLIDQFLGTKKVWGQPEVFSIYHPVNQSVNNLACKTCMLNVVEKSLSGVAHFHVILISHLII